IVAMDLTTGDTRELTEAGCAASPSFRGTELVYAASPEAPRCLSPWLAASGGAPNEACDLALGGAMVAAPGFDGEPFARGAAVVFTSTRDGDPELYRLDDGALLRL